MCPGRPALTFLKGSCRLLDWRTGLAARAQGSPAWIATVGGLTDGFFTATIHADGGEMVNPPARPADSEKITINLGFVDLGNIDLLVAEGFYSNRTDLIRTAIRAQLDRHADVLKQSTIRKQLDLGLQHYSRAQLESVRAAGRTIDIRVIGLARIAADVSPELARATIASVSVLGALQASSAVRAVLADRMTLP